MSYDRNFEPPKPVGSGPFITFCQWVWQRLTTPYQDTDTIKWNVTTRGISARAVVRASGGGGSSAAAGMVFRGLWHGAALYMAQDVVFRTPSGGSAGVYIALLDNVPLDTAPETGAPYWAAFPYPPPGVWG